MLYQKVLKEYLYKFKIKYELKNELFKVFIFKLKKLFIKGVGVGVNFYTIFNILKSHQSDIPIRIEFLLHSLSIYSSLSDSLFHVFRAVDNQSD